MTGNADALEAAHKDAVFSPPPPPVRNCPRKSWIEIHLEDEDGNHVPNEEYKIVVPDGTEITGTLDENGFARVDGIDPGQCKVSFPRLHHREWHPK